MASSNLNDLEKNWRSFRHQLEAGSNDISLLENMRGFNHLGHPGFLPKNKDIQGFVFFTRPQLNLSLGNLQFNRRFLALLDNTEASMARYIRIMLDPRLMAGFVADNTLIKEIPNSPFNNEHAFIPLLTNSIVSLTGWPDVVVPSTPRPKGLYGEEPAIVDGSTYIRNQISLNASFRNSTGNPIGNMMLIWANYMAAVFEGTLSPYPDMLVENEIDYNTRIFRVLLDTTGQFVTNIAATGPGFVESVGIGKHFNYTTEEIYSDTSADIDFSFKFHGVEYNDPVLIYEFNKITAIFKPEMFMPTESDLIKIPHYLKKAFKFEGYPHINYVTGEFELYVEPDLVETLLLSRVEPRDQPALVKLVKESNKKGSDERKEETEARFKAMEDSMLNKRKKR